jgi:hypothetical protein
MMQVEYTMDQVGNQWTEFEKNALLPEVILTREAGRL